MCQHDVTLANPIRGRLNAWFFRVFDDYINRLSSSHKLKLFAELPDNVVEIGAGVGANFRYFRPKTLVTAVEPNAHMRPGLVRQAAAYDVKLDVLACGAEDIPLPDESVDVVICTLVLCTVPDPAAAVAEIRRILKPSGRFLFMEHVAAPANSWRRKLQNLVHRPWHYAFEGCHTNRETENLIRSAGFQDVRSEEFLLRGPFVPVATQISGVAVK